MELKYRSSQDKHILAFNSKTWEDRNYQSGTQNSIHAINSFFLFLDSIGSSVQPHGFSFYMHSLNHIHTTIMLHAKVILDLDYWCLNVLWGVFLKHAFNLGIDVTSLPFFFLFAIFWLKLQTSWDEKIFQILISDYIQIRVFWRCVLSSFIVDQVDIY